MKIAYVISAYKYPEQLSRLIIALHTENTSFFVHIDKKTNINIYKQIVCSLSHIPNVYFLERHKCYWGDFGHVKATIKGIKEIFHQNISFDWFILLTGQDYPLKSNHQIESFLQNNQGKIFITYDNYPTTAENEVISGTDRIDYWHFTWNKMKFVFPGNLTANTANKFRVKKYIGLRLFSKIWSCFVVLFPIKRNFPEGFQPFIGSSYFCLPRGCVEYIDNFIIENPKFVNFFKHVDIPDEMFFQTIILNSIFKKKVINDNLFYIDWKNPNPKNPRVFVKSDFEMLMSSSKLFARKFDITRDADILNMIDEMISSKNT